MSTQAVTSFNRLKTFVYLTVLLTTSLLTIIPLVMTFFYSKFKQRKMLKDGTSKKRVLVTGAPHTKGLQICRILASAGHEIILADMKKFEWSAARFSNCVSRWYSLPNLHKDNKDEYMSSMISLIDDEKIDWWLPVSHTCTAVVDTEINVYLQKTRSNVKVLSIDDVKTAEMLDDKLTFLSEAQALGLPVPKFYKIQSSQDVFTLWSRGIFSNTHFFLKPLNPYSEDRVCFSRIPDNLQELTSFLRTYTHKITPQNPYFVSEFVKGDEYTGNIIAKNGRIYLYVSNPSSPMQIDYVDARDKTKIYDWIQRFVSNKKLSGSLCFDFMEHPHTGEMMGIECNPRLHSSIVLMDDKRNETASAIYQALECVRPSSEATASFELPVTPNVKGQHVFWLYNELSKLLSGEAPAAMSRLLRGRDAVWDSSDPLPFFLLPHLQIPSLLCQQLSNVDRWNIVNFCLGQLR